MSQRTWSADVRDIGDRISALTIERAAELGDYLEKIHGVQAATATAVKPDLVVEPDAADGPVTPTEYSVILQGFPAARRIAVIRAVRELTGVGLKEALDLVNSVPRAIKAGLFQEEAEKVKAQLEAAGAEVVLE